MTKVAFSSLEEMEKDQKFSLTTPLQKKIILFFFYEAPIHTEAR